LDQALSLIQKVAKEDVSAFNQLYELFKDRVYNTALSYSQNREDAEELTQDVFTKIYKNAANFKANSAVSTWIYRITVNASLNYINKKKLKVVGDPNETLVNPIDFDHPGILLEQKENAKHLFKVIDTLPENQKTAFILSFIEQLPRQEVADVMDTSLKAVESLNQRAKQNLRKKLDKYYTKRRNS
jgi:RNA polymerase sigma-70 factor (ECF subfamily)